MAEAKKKRGVIEAAARVSNVLMQKFMPDAYVFAVALTVIVFVAAFFATGQSPIRLAVHWGQSVWSLLAFTMQMVLVLVTGHVLALAPAFKKLLDKLSNIPKTPAQGIILVTVISHIACILNWGFGLVIGAIYAKEIAKDVADRRGDSGGTSDILKEETFKVIANDVNPRDDKRFLLIGGFLL